MLFMPPRGTGEIAWQSFKAFDLKVTRELVEDCRRGVITCLNCQQTDCGVWLEALPCRRTRWENWPTGANDCLDPSDPLAECQVFQIRTVTNGHEPAFRGRLVYSNSIGNEFNVGLVADNLDWRVISIGIPPENA